MNKLTICFIVVLVSAVALLVLCLSGRRGLSRQIVLDDKKYRQRERRERRLGAFYRAAQKIPILGSYAKKVSASYRNQCPYDEYSLYRVSAITIFLVTVFSTVATLAVFALSIFVDGHITLYSVGCALFAIYVISTETLNSRLTALNRSMMDELVGYISAVRHSYEACPNIPNAIVEASRELSYELRMHVLKITDILTGANRAEKVRNYVLSDENGKYFKMFMLQAYEASEREGVKKAQGASVFSHNMEFLRVSIMRERINSDRQAFKLQGYTFAVIFPLFCMSILRQWGTDFSSEMSAFYATTGRFIEITTCLASFFLYGLVTRSREMALQVGTFSPKFLERITADGRGRKLVLKLDGNTSDFAKKLKSTLASAGMSTSFGLFFLRMVIYAFCTFVAATFMFSVLHYHEREQLLTEVENIDSIVAVASQKQKDAISTAILEITSDLRDVKEVSEEYVRQAFLSKVFLTNQSIIDASVKEILRRIDAYQKNYFKWYELLCSVVLGVLFAFVPMVEVVYQRSVVRELKNSEVKLFQSLILMEREFPSVTVLSLLEEMETFSVVFRKSIRECINNCSSGRVSALKKLKEEEGGFERFGELIDGFLVADKVGIKKAFDELESNMDMYEEANKLEGERSMEKKRDFVELLSYIPAALVVVAYFIAPFCIYTLSGVGDIFTAIEELQSLGL